MFNLHLVNAADCVGGVWPAIRPSNAVPKRLTTFYPKTAKDNGDAFCHFFIDDYRFAKVWNEPERYVPVLKRYAGAIMPNFSTWHIMPLPMQYYMLYRNRALAYYWQQNGIDVIPLLQCGDPRTYDYAFEGLPIGGTYAVMNNGLMKEREDRFYWYEFLEIAVDAVKPDLLVMYGSEVRLNLPCEVRWYKNDNTARVRGNCKQLTSPECSLRVTEEEVTRAALIDASERVVPDTYIRAMSATPIDERNPLAYTDDIDTWEPYYARGNEPFTLPEGKEWPLLDASEDGIRLRENAKLLTSGKTPQLPMEGI